MAISNKARGLKDNEHYNTGNGRVFVKAPPAFPGKRYIKDKSAPQGRYAYRYAVEAWKQTGRVADPKKEIVHHTTKAYDDENYTAHDDRNVAIESRRKHYKHGHGRPFSRPGGKRPKPRGF